jgi:cytoskeleton protein RodZ
MFGVEPNEFIDDRNEDGVAALLRRRREELGRDVTTVARQLRIRAVYINAIEEGRLQDLPGTAYAVGFVRAYADYLGLDGNSIVGDYRDELARRSRQNQLIWPVDQVEHKHFPGGIVLVVSLLVAVAFYGGWYVASLPGGTGIDLIDQVPELMKKQTSGDAPEGGEAPAEEAPGQSGAATEPATDSTGGTTPASAQASQPAPTAEPATAEPVTAAPVVTVPAAAPATAEATVAEPPIAAAAATAPAAITEVAVPAPAPAAEPVATEEEASASDETPEPVQLDQSNGQTATIDQQPTEAATSDVPAEAAAATVATPGKRIVLRATKDSWVEIFDAQEEVVLQRILRAGETYAVPDQPGLTMNTGNAGGVVIELDGKARPALGSIGVVKRGVKLDPSVLGGQ